MKVKECALSWGECVHETLLRSCTVVGGLLFLPVLQEGQQKATAVNVGLCLGEGAGDVVALAMDVEGCGVGTRQSRHQIPSQQSTA